MRRILALFLLLIFLSSAAAFSEPLTPYDYIVAKGFTITESWDNPGSLRCYLMETATTQTLTFSDGAKAHSIVFLRDHGTGYDISNIRILFCDLIDRFAWDLSYYWPDYDNDKQIEISFGITKDVDRTKNNFSSQEEYLAELRSLLLIENTPVVDHSDTLSWISLVSKTMNSSGVMAAQYARNAGFDVTIGEVHPNEAAIFLIEYDSASNMFQDTDYEIRFNSGERQYIIEGKILVQSERDSIRQFFLDFVAEFDWDRVTIAPLNSDRWIHYNDNGYIDDRDVYYYDKERFIQVITEYFAL